MQSLIWSQNSEQYIWSDEIARFIVYPVVEWQLWFVRAYHNDGMSIPLAQFETKLEALSFVVRTILEINKAVPVDLG